MQLWRGIVVSTDPDAERHASSGSSKLATDRQSASCAGISGSKGTKPTALSVPGTKHKGCSKWTTKQSVSNADTKCRTVESWFGGLSSKGKRKKWQTSSQYHDQSQNGNAVSAHRVGAS